MSFGKKLKYARNFRKLKGVELAQSSGLSIQSGRIRISEYEREVKFPRSTKILDICDVLEINPYYLTAGNNPCANINVVQYLFELDRIYDLDIRLEEDNSISISFQESEANAILKKLLTVWHDMKFKAANDGISQHEYEEWKLQFPYTKDELKKSLRSPERLDMFFSGDSEEKMEIQMEKYIEKYINEFLPENRREQ